ncbi:UNVERIFIED_CONTAM: hypothetical protein Slati_2437100 [Sesamum latifolium]|uniref:Retrotransposon gag domain-containing protein n=1 Tax=Sesamum latifolium TaxID=2727402 RepID=A0AAW2WHU0_9LAMI
MADELPLNCRTPAIAEYDGTADPMEHLSRFENAALLHRYTDGIKCRVFVTTFAGAAQQWFNQLPVGAIGSFQEFRSLFLHQFTSSRKVQYRCTGGTHCHARSKSQCLLPRALGWRLLQVLGQKTGLQVRRPLGSRAKYINMEEAQAAKKDSRGEKRKEAREDAPSKKPRGDLRDRKTPFQRVNTVYTPLTVPITQAFMAVEEKGLITRPRSWRHTPQRPKSDKFCHFHNDYGYTTEECRHLKNKIERLIQNGTCKNTSAGSHRYWSLSEERMRQSKGGEVVQPRGMVSLPLTMGRGTTRKTCLLKFIVVDVPSAYNVILGRPTLNTFQAVVSTYHMKIKFPTPGGMGEVQGDPLQSKKCYVEAVRKGQKRNVDDALD